MSVFTGSVQHCTRRFCVCVRLLILCVVGFDAGLEQLHRAGDVRFVDNICHADLVLAGVGGLVEALCRSEHERLAVVVPFIEHEHLELFCIVNGQGGHDIERTLGLGVHDTGDLLETLDEAVLSCAVFLADSVKILGADGVQRSGSDLVDGGGAQTALAPLHCVIVQLRVAGYHAADSCAAV